MKRRYKLLIGIIVVSIIVLIINIITNDRKLFYLSLGDSLAVGLNSNGKKVNSYGDYIKDYFDKKGKLEIYINEYAKSGYRSIDLLNDIKNNKKLRIQKKVITLKNALVKADIITLSIGANDLFYKLKLGSPNPDDVEIYEYVDQVFYDMENLFSELRSITKEKIYVLGFYNPFVVSSVDSANDIEPVIEYANEKLEWLSNEYNIRLINVQNVFSSGKNMLSSDYEIYPTDNGYKAIAKEIINNLDKKILAK